MRTKRRTWTVIAVTALLAASTQAAGPEPHFGNNDDVKVNISNMEVGWPLEYVALDTCVIPVYMEVGSYLEIGWPFGRRRYRRPDNDDNDFVPDLNDITLEGADRKIDLRQVDCDDIGRNSETDWPCFHDCEEIKIRANFDLKLSATLYKASDLIEEWEAYFEGTDIITGSGEWQTVKVCVIAWRARLAKEMGGTKVKVGDLTVTIKPDV